MHALIVARKQHRRPRRKGAVTVEFAITAPILFLLVFSMIEFARFNMIRHGIDTAAYEGARRGIVPGASANDVKTTASNILTAVSTVGGTVLVNPATITDDTTAVTVTVQVAINKNGWIVPHFFKPSTLSRSCTLAREKTKNY